MQISTHFVKTFVFFLSVDATKDDERLINNSRRAANVLAKVLDVDGRTRLCLIAAKDIQRGEQLQYDYGDR